MQKSKDCFLPLSGLKFILSYEKQYMPPLSRLMQKTLWWFISIDEENSLESWLLIELLRILLIKTKQKIPLFNYHWLESENYFRYDLSLLVNTIQKVILSLEEHVISRPNIISGTYSLNVIWLEGMVA